MTDYLTSRFIETEKNMSFTGAYAGLLVRTAGAFEAAGATLFANEIRLRDLLSTGGESTNPTTLAEYQAVISEISILRNAQSSTVKTLKDIDATIVANFR